MGRIRKHTVYNTIFVLNVRKQEDSIGRCTFEKKLEILLMAAVGFVTKQLKQRRIWFQYEWDAYFHTNCLEQALLSDDIRTRREAQVVAREFRVEFEEHEEDFCMITFIRVVMRCKGIYGLWQSV